MTVLARETIVAEMAKTEDPLVITPILEKSQIGEASVDVRLGYEFIVLLRSGVAEVDATSDDEQIWQRIRYRSQQKVRIALHQRLIIHPGQLVLAATLEYVSMPKSLSGVVEGRSSWGRLGLIIATANTIGPGFKGCVTLEIINNGDVPIALYPGLPIAQLVFHRNDGKGEYLGRYNCPTGPEFSRIFQDKRLKWWGPKGQA
jgi:dCTP deaminase